LTAALIANPPKSVPLRPLKLPLNRPMGVRAPATITEVLMGPTLVRNHTFTNQRYGARGHTAFPPPHFPDTSLKTFSESHLRERKRLTFKYQASHCPPPLLEGCDPISASLVLKLIPDV
jgi:hypothetical protein